MSQIATVISEIDYYSLEDEINENTNKHLKKLDIRAITCELKHYTALRKSFEGHKCDIGIVGLLDKYISILKVWKRLA